MSGASSAGPLARVSKRLLGLLRELAVIHWLLRKSKTIFGPVWRSLFPGAVENAGMSIKGMAAVPTSDSTVLYRFPDNPPEGRFPYSMCLGVPQPPFIQEWGLRDLRASAGWQRDSDIWVATYPKNGTTWMLQIIKLLLSDGEMPEGKRIDLSPCSPDVPWPEAAISLGKSHEWLAAIPGSRRVFKTHQPLHTFPSMGGAGGRPCAGSAKIVVVTRNPKDTVVSYAHHRKSKPHLAGDIPLSDFFEMFMAGDAPAGDWFEWTADWWAAAQRFPDQILWLHYEAMLAEPAAAIKRVADFVGIACPEGLLAKTLENSSFDKMKKEHGAVCESNDKHFRKGESGGWQNQLTDAQGALIDAAMKRLPTALQADYSFGV